MHQLLFLTGGVAGPPQRGQARRRLPARREGEAQERVPPLRLARRRRARRRPGQGAPAAPAPAAPPPPPSPSRGEGSRAGALPGGRARHQSARRRLASSGAIGSPRPKWAGPCGLRRGSHISAGCAFQTRAARAWGLAGASERRPFAATVGPPERLPGSPAGRGECAWAAAPGLGRRTGRVDPLGCLWRAPCCHPVSELAGPRGAGGAVRRAEADRGLSVRQPREQGSVAAEGAIRGFQPCPDRHSVMGGRRRNKLHSRV